ncbi:30S ribosomal protein S27ae [Candidatus Woesearchaeota archaeon]|nr:30S ribosomal protein S27ae [Candidatus Woesearchaeota archaeon]
MAAEKAATGKIKKKKGSQTWKYYEAKGELKRTKRVCPKCGEATFMAAHKDRYACGKCKYTEFVSKK